MEQAAPRVFILLERGISMPQLEQALDRRAIGNWRENDRIVVDDPSDPRVIRTANRVVVRGIGIRTCDHLVLTKNARKYYPVLQGELPRAATRVCDFRELSDADPGGYLEQVLRSASLSKEQLIATTLAKNLHRPGEEIALRSIEAWRKQWMRIGEGKLGDLLLDLVDVRETVDVCRLLWPEPTALEKECIRDGSLAICTLTGMGTSGGIIARSIRQYVNARMDEKLSDLLRDKHCERIIAVDDGLWSGFDAIKQITTALDGGDVERRLRAAHIELRFAFHTDLGKHALKSFLKEKALHGVHISPAIGEESRVLTAEGARACDDGRINHQVVTSYGLDDDWVQPRAIKLLQDLDVKPTSLRKLGLVCKALVSSGSMVDDVEKRGTQYGTNNIGGTIAFTHGVPMALLPCFRIDAPIRIEGTSSVIEWRGLFAEAKNRA